MGFSQLVSSLNGLIWSPALIALCLGAGLFFTLRTGFVQVRHVKSMFTCLFAGKSSVDGISAFQAFALAVSGRVGTGNIAGVATAIALGGPGAVFWMWVIAFVGSGSAFVEAALAQIFKKKVDGQYRGGPAYYIEQGLGLKWYAQLFAVATIIGCGLCLPTVQSNSIGSAMETAFGTPLWVSGAGVIFFLGLIIVGGIKRIGFAVQMIVPVMAIGYIAVALVVLAANLSALPSAFALIFKSALGLEATYGGILGSALSWGVKRGIYSNEAGQGTAPMAAAAAESDHPAKQGLVQAFSIYFDTWLVCTATALMILVAGSYNVSDGNGAFLYEGLAGVEMGPGYTQAAIENVLPGFGSVFVALALLFFAFTTILAYYYYTENNIAYLLPEESPQRTLIFNLTKVFFLAIVFLGAVNPASLVWDLGDIGVGIMAWVNIIAILFLSGPALRCLKDYEDRLKTGRKDTFSSADIGVRSSVWVGEEKQR